VKSSSRKFLLTVLLSAAFGFGAARLTAPEAPGEGIRREVERQAGRSERLAAQLADMQAQIQRSRPGEVVVSPPPASAEAEAPALARPVDSAATAEPAPAGPPATSTPESLEALARGRKLLDDAIASHRWGPGEVAELRQLMVDMSGPHRLAVMQSLAAALNRGDFKGTLSALLVD
jgi:hypothetical protein